MMEKEQKDWVNYASQHLDKIIWVGGLGYLLGVSLWLFQQDRFPWIERGDRLTSIAQTTVQSQKEQENRRFIAYLQQSLKSLETESSLDTQPPREINSENTRNKGKTPTPMESPFATITLPKPNTLPSPLSEPINSTPRVVERYYYPVYPTAREQTTLSQLYPGQTSPSALAKKLSSLQAKPSIAKISPPQPQPIKLKPTGSMVAVQPSPALNAGIAPMVTTKTRYALVGVLESGDRSSALFNWNHLTQRLQIGEAIGSSGWVLTGVDNQKAILTRSGQTRYLEVGESF